MRFKNLWLRIGASRDDELASGTRQTETPHPREVMKAGAFERTPEFTHFKAVMRRVLAVPKIELDALVEQAKAGSPRNGDKHAPGRKRGAKQKRKRPLSSSAVNDNYRTVLATIKRRICGGFSAVDRVGRLSNAALPSIHKSFP